MSYTIVFKLPENEEVQELEEMDHISEEGEFAEASFGIKPKEVMAEQLEGRIFW